MAFPVISSPTDTDFGTSVTSMSVNLPGSIAAGDLLLAFVSVRNAGTWTTIPSGWTKISEQGGGGSVGEGSIFYKIADGTEGSTATWVTDTSTSGAWQTRKVTNWHGTTPPEVGTAASGDSSSANPPSLTPSWGAEDTLWVVVATHAAVSTGAFTAAPTNYTGFANNGASSGGAACSVASAYRNLNASSEDPGTFTAGGSNRWWTAQTIAIRPLATTPVATLLATGVDGGVDALSITTDSSTDVLVVLAGIHQGTIDGVTFDGDALTKIDGGDTAFHEREELYILRNPAAKTANLVMSYTGGSGPTMIAIKVANADDTADPTEHANSNGNSSSATVSKTPASNNGLLIGGVYSEAVPTAGKGNSLAVIQAANSYENSGGSYRRQAAATAFTFSWSLSSGQRWATVAAVFYPPASSTATNDSRDAETTGKDTANDSRSAEVTGKDTSNDARDAEVIGKTTANDSRDAETAGKDTSNDTREAETTGKDSSNDSRDAEVSGKDTNNDVRDAEITGKDTSSDSREAETTGKDTANATRDAEVTGTDIANDSRIAETTGSDSSNDVRDAELTGQDSSTDNREAETSGQDSVSDSRDAEVIGDGGASDSRSAEVTGKDSANDSRDAEVRGSITIGNNIVQNGSFEIGSGTNNSNFSVPGWAVTIPASNSVVSIDNSQAQDGSQSVKLVVDSLNSNNGIKDTNVMTVIPSTKYRMTLFVKSNTAGALQIQLRKSTSGHYLQSDRVTWNATPSYFSINTTTGFVVYSLEFTTDAGQTTLIISDLKRSGSGSQANRTFWIDNVSIIDISCERSAETIGQDSTSDTREATVQGQDSTQDTRDAEVTGKDTSTDERASETTGKASDASLRDAETTGKDLASSERDTETSGKDNAAESRDAEVAGLDSANSSRDAETTGNQQDISERSAETRGQATETSERSATLEGVLVAQDDRSAEITGKSYAKKGFGVTPLLTSQKIAVVETKNERVALTTKHVESVLTTTKRTTVLGTQSRRPVL